MLVALLDGTEAEIAEVAAGLVFVLHGGDRVRCIYNRTQNDGCG
jgi:hypothetical protein